MIIIQEEGGKIEDFFYDKISSCLKHLEVVATDTHCDTDVLKALCDVTVNRLNEFTKFIEKIEQETAKTTAKIKQRYLKHPIAEARGF